MKFIRFKKQDSTDISQGYITGAEIKYIRGNIFGKHNTEGTAGNLKDVKLLSPCTPGKIIAIAANYKGATGVTDDMKEPIVFIKPATSIVGPEEDIFSPFKGMKVWGEAELAIVIGRRLRGASLSEAKKAIFGYVCANDVTSENIEGRDHHLVRSKGADTFCPLGPWVDTDFSPSNANIEAFQNGKLIRKGNLKDRIWDDGRIIRWLSQWMTLQQGDVILTGTPPRVVERTYLNEGDIFEVRIEGLGNIKNRFVNRNIV